MSKKKYVRIVAIILAILMPVFTATMVFAEDRAMSSDPVENDPVGSQSYASPDINKLTGHGEEPEELSVSAGANYLEKAWYEYVVYSDHAVCSYRINDDSRLIFYDPYTYTNALVMDVNFDPTTTNYDTMSSYTVSQTNSKTITACVSSTETDTNAIQTSGRDLTGSTVTNTGSTTTNYNHSIDNPTSGTVTETTKYDYKEYILDTNSDTTKKTYNEGGEVGGVGDAIFSAITGDFVGAALDMIKGLKVSGGAASETSHTDQHTHAMYQDTATKETKYSDDYKTTTQYNGSDTVEYDTKSTTTGWSELSDRVTKTIGSSISTSNSWSETESTTITKTYDATHFSSDNVTPLPWAIVHYQVQMPMKCCLQVKYSGEWITISTCYCLLTTVQGTCRSWMQNGQAYYEDWGSGEPVVATDFWAQFMTKEQLVNAYSKKLYPVGGID